ncbi:MAG: uroporphyrinogen decarboxylase family protein [Anaerolineae bacterium]
MQSKERVRRALTRQGLPDRVPVQFDLSAPLLQAFSARLGIPLDYAESYYEDLKYRISANDLRTAMGSDCVVVGAGPAASFTPQQQPGGLRTNEFGMGLRQSPLYMEVIQSPLRGADLAAVESYTFPDPHDPTRYGKAEAEIARYRDDYFVIGDVELTMFELSWHLVGMEQYMLDLALGEPYIEALLAKAARWSLGIAEELARRGVDALWFGDDFGSQNGLLLSPVMWRRVFKPLYAQIFAAARALRPDLLIILHSDGAVAELLPDLIEIGLDVFNPVQPNVPGHEPLVLKERFGDRLSFFGAIDQQELLPRGTAAEIAQDVREKIAVLGAGGGYMAAPAHIIQADTSPENVEAFIAAVRAYGEYR